MDHLSLRAHCLGKPGASDEHPFGPGALVLKVAGKIFAIIDEDADPATISLKCDPAWAPVLRDTYAAVVPGYHLNKRHWNTVTVDGTIPDDEVRDWIDESYELVVNGLPRRVQAELRGEPA